MGVHSVRGKMLKAVLLAAAVASASGFVTGAVGRLPMASKGMNARGMQMQQQRESSESAQAYQLRLREFSGYAKSVSSAIPAGAVLSQIALPVQEAAAKGG